MITDEMIARVESGTGADDDLDGMIFDALSSGPIGSAREAVIDRRKRPNWLPRYTASLDAVLALIEAKLPGWFGDVDIGAAITESGSFGARLFRPDENPWGNIAGEGQSPARALLAATLKAIEETTDARD